MTDFSHARTVRCHVCGTPFCDVEGPLCDCRQCEGCGEWFTDPFDLVDGLCEACRPPEREDEDDEQKDFTHACQSERTL